MKKIKNLMFGFLLLVVTFPINIFAYSDYIVASGQNIGIELNSKNILIVGTYKIGNKDPASDAGLRSGDRIIKVNNNIVNNIDDMLNITSKTENNQIDITYNRAGKEYHTSLKLIMDNDNILKTGLYVKDSITGVGTLTFIDPNTHLFGALGHEILDNSTGQKLELKSGKIYNSSVTGITPSDSGKPGEKNARYDTSTVYGFVKENTSSGVFGNYTNDIDKSNLYKVAGVDEINEGNAKILTVIENNTVEKFDIKILNINKNKKSSKNILFEIIDKDLLNQTGGIVQGMSGSPIIQDDKIIGAVTHVIVDNPSKGYGIFITTMLEEAEN